MADDSYREGFRAGWLDRGLGHRLFMAYGVSQGVWGRYSDGYRDGQRHYNKTETWEEAYTRVTKGGR